MGMSSSDVVRRLFRRGLTLALVQKLYAGAVGAALCSIAVGAVHFASFETSRRLLLTHAFPVAPAAPPAASLAAAQGSGAAVEACDASSPPSSSPSSGGGGATPAVPVR